MGDVVNFPCKWNPQHGCFCDMGELEEVWPLGLALSRGLVREMRVYWFLGFVGGVVVLIVLWMGCRRIRSSPEDSKPKDE